MAKSGKGQELECQTPEARLDRIEKALILLGRRLDGYFGYEGDGENLKWENLMRDVLNIKENK